MFCQGLPFLLKDMKAAFVSTAGPILREVWMNRIKTSLCGDQRDGFVETIVFNTALMRRRIRDPHLVMEMTEAGQASRTDIAVCYMSDRVDRELLKNLKNRIESLQVGDLRMNQQSLAEALFKRKWFNPFPKFKYTERPDTAAACLLEGKVVVLVDNSPSALIPANLDPGYD